MTVTFHATRQQVEAAGGSGSIHTVAAPLIEPSATSLEFGRFLLTSTLFHVLLAWAVVTLPFFGIQPAEQPLQVKLVEADAPKPLPASSRPARARARAQTAARPSPQVGAPDTIAPRELSTPSTGRVVAAPPRTIEGISSTGSDDSRRTASPPSAKELVRDLGLTAGASPAPGRLSGGGGPKAIGEPPIGAGVTIVPSVSLSSGPAVIGGPGGGDGSGGSRSGGQARRLDDGLMATLAPPVTVGPRQGAGGRLGAGRDRAAAPAGGFSGPDYDGNRPPAYPPLAREKGYEGTVYLRVEVRGDGRVGGLTIDRSSGYEILDRAAAESVKAWTFLPAQKGGKPVTSWVLLPVKFMLR